MTFNYFFYRFFSDSFLFKVSNPDVFWSEIKDFIDYSNYEKDHPQYSEENKAKLGFFKNEFGGSKKCTEFIGLRAKCYSFNLVDKKNQVKSSKFVCKGIARTVIKNRLKFKQYKDCLLKRKIKRHDFAAIRSTKHKISTIFQRKKALTHFDSKRWLFDCGIHNVPYGSKVIDKFYNTCPSCK